MPEKLDDDIKWRAFSKAVFAVGERVTACEFELIHGIKEMDKRISYMNWRLVRATLHAVRVGIPVKELVQL